MSIFKIMELIGVPSIFAISLFTVRTVVKLAKQINILQRSQKAQMRAMLLKDYETYEGRGYVRQLELDEWMNQYESYHALVGNNGVLDNRKDILLRLPCHD